MENSQISGEIHQYLLIIKRRFFPAFGVFLFVFILGTVTTILKKPTYEARASLKLRKINPSSSLTDLSKEIGDISSLGLKSNPLSTQVEVIRSQPLIEKTISDLKLQDKQGKTLKVSQILKALQVKAVTATDILEISYQDSDPKLAAQMVNTLVDNYIEYNTRVNRSEAILAREFLQKQLPTTEATLEQLEASILKIQEENQIISLEEESASIANSLQAIRQSIDETRSQLASSTSQAEFISNQLGMNSEKALVTTAFNQSSAVEQSLQQLKLLESQLAEQQSRFTEANPKIIELKEKIQLQQELLQQEINNVAGNQGDNLVGSSQLGQIQQDLAAELVKLEANNIGLIKRLEHLTKTEQIQRQRAKILPKLRFQLRQLERKLAVSQDSYNLLLNKLKTLEIVENQNISSVRVLSAASIPQEPINNRSIGYMSSLFLGLISASGVIYLLEIIDNFRKTTDRSLKTVEEAKQLLGYTELGVIPEIDFNKLPLLPIHNKESNIAVTKINQYPSSAMGELYRNLHTRFKFLCYDQKIKTVVITSSITQEGKSSVAANLASSMAQVGDKVLLIDANLYSPIQHQIWNVYAEPGLSNFIAEQLTLESVTQKVMTNLDLISSGTISPSSDTLIDSERMKSLIDLCSTIYDFIIIDSPALNKAADALNIGTMADGVILTVKPGHVTYSEAEFAQGLLELSGQNILGLVLNGVNSQVESHNYYPDLEDLQDNEQLLSILEPEQDSLWETISLEQKNSSIDKFDNDFNLAKIEHTPIEKIENIVLDLEKHLYEIARTVQEQEDELLIREQTVKQLQEKLNLESDRRQSVLEQQLSLEQECLNLLSKTLVGQRGNLEKRKELLLQYQQLLYAKKIGVDPKVMSN